jgi:hypothetical protein
MPATDEWPLVIAMMDGFGPAYLQASEMPSLRSLMRGLSAAQGISTGRATSVLRVLNGRVLLPDGSLAEEAVTIEDGVISAVGGNGGASRDLASSGICGPAFRPGPSTRASQHVMLRRIEPRAGGKPPASIRRSSGRRRQHG